MKRKVQNVEPIVADLDRIEDDDLEVLETPTNAASSGFDEMDDFKRFPFLKKDSFIIMSEKLQEFRRVVLDEHPKLRSKDKVNDPGFEKTCLSVKWGEQLLKDNLNLFNYLTFDLEYDKASNSLSRIALFRKHIIELKMVYEGLDIEDYIANKKICFEFCERIGSARDQSDGSSSKHKRK